MDQQSIPPHSYSLIARTISVCLIVLLVYAFSQLPYYFVLRQKLCCAEKALKEGNYVQASEQYHALCEQLPSVKEIKLHLIEAYFSQGKFDEGGHYLKDLKLTRAEIEKLNKYLPENVRIVA